MCSRRARARCTGVARRKSTSSASHSRRSRSAGGGHAALASARLLGAFARRRRRAGRNVGLVFVDGKLRAALTAGAYAFWNFGKNVGADVVDLRLQTVEVAGQEILTRDKVSLRVNLTALWQCVDAVARATRSQLRITSTRNCSWPAPGVGRRRWTSCWATRARSTARLSPRRAGASASRFAAALVGVKDVILPGEMKAILNRWWRRRRWRRPT